MKFLDRLYLLVDPSKFLRLCEGVCANSMTQEKGVCKTKGKLNPLQQAIS